MKLCLIYLIGLMLSFLCCVCSADEEPPNALTNRAFESGLDGWQKHGDVAVVAQAPQTGKPCVQIGTGSGAVRQRADVGALRIVYLGADLGASSADIAGIICVRCYDSRRQLVMEERQPIDAKQAAAGSTKPGLYFKTHGRTAYIVVSIEKETGAAGFFYLNSAQLNITEEAKRQRPLCSLNEYMQPFWTGSTVVDEAVLMLAANGKPATGKLMYPPTSILSVRSFSPPRRYLPGRDYRVEGNVITCTRDSIMPISRSTDFEAGDLKWFDLAGKQIFVTYTHGGSWHGPISTYQGSRIPHIINKLKQRSPVTIVATGDSITLGVGTSGYSGRPPYMPTWPELFVRRLQQLYGYKSGKAGIQLFNTALGGQTSDWGKETAAGAVASLKPDLAIIAFGMNDFWWMDADRFRDNVEAIIRDIRVADPSAEFVLVASMRFDPAYALDPQYHARLESYTPALKSLTGQGVVLLDMDAISYALAQAKKPKDINSDPLHPNDFLARWYAQSMSALLDDSVGSL